MRIQAIIHVWTITLASITTADNFIPHSLANSNRRISTAQNLKTKSVAAADLSKPDSTRFHSRKHHHTHARHSSTSLSPILSIGTSLPEQIRPAQDHHHQTSTSPSAESAIVEARSTRFPTGTRTLVASPLPFQSTALPAAYGKVKLHSSSATAIPAYVAATTAVLAARSATTATRIDSGAVDPVRLGGSMEAALGSRHFDIDDDDDADDGAEIGVTCNPPVHVVAAAATQDVSASATSMSARITDKPRSSADSVAAGFGFDAVQSLLVGLGYLMVLAA